MAAFLAPHVILFGLGGVVIVLLPDWARAFARKREVVASACLLAPTFATTRALERCEKGLAGSAERSGGDPRALGNGGKGGRCCCW